MIKELESLKKTEKDIKAVLNGKKDTFVLDDTEAYTKIFKEEDFNLPKTILKIKKSRPSPGRSLELIVNYLFILAEKRIFLSEKNYFKCKKNYFFISISNLKSHC